MVTLLPTASNGGHLRYGRRTNEEITPGDMPHHCYRHLSARQLDEGYWHGHAFPNSDQGTTPCTDAKASAALSKIM